MIYAIALHRFFTIPCIEMYHRQYTIVHRPRVSITISIHIIYQYIDKTFQEALGHIANYNKERQDVQASEFDEC